MGYFRWGVFTGDSNRPNAVFATWVGAERFANELRRAFADGFYVADCHHKGVALPLTKPKNGGVL